LVPISSRLQLEVQDDASNRVADLIPEDIESIEILKGASAAAIYGVGGAGGVVVIKTKSGKYNQDTRVNFSQTLGISSPTRLLGDRGWDRAKVASVFSEEEAERFDMITILSSRSHHCRLAVVAITQSFM